MKFNAKKAEHDYITDNSMSYRRLAEKYEVNPTTITKYAKKGDWVQKRKEYQARVAQKAIEKAIDKESDKLSTLSSATDKAIEIVAKIIANATEDEESITIKSLKDITSTLKDLVGLQRNLNGILTKQEENALTIAREKLQLERERIGFDEGESGETGIVVMPALAPDETENIVYEGETNV